MPAFHRGFCAPERRPRILWAAILASAMGFIDGTVVAIAIPAMRETLGAGLTEVQWINNAYMLPLSALVLIGGAFGDRFGLARVFASGIALFMAASLAAALAPTAGFLIAARAAQGLAAALMVPGSLAIISRAYPRPQRGAAIGTWAAASAITTALGPVIGGLLLGLWGESMWRWIFAVNLVLGSIALWLLYTTVEQDRAQPERGIDLVGAGLAAVGLGAISWALTGALHSGSRAAVAGFAAVGVVALGLFLLHERRTAQPMLDLVLFARRGFAAANVVTFCLYFSLSAILFFLPMTLIAAWGRSEIEAALAFAPLSAAIALLSRPFGQLADRTGPAAPVAIGSLLVAAGFAVLAFTVQEQDYWWRVLPGMTVMGLGMSMVVAPLSAAVMGAAGSRETGAASGVNNAVSRIAGLMAVAAMGSVAAIVYLHAGGTRSFGASTGGLAHVAATNSGFAAIAWTTAALSTLAAAVAWFGLPRGPSRPAAQTGS